MVSGALKTEGQRLPKKRRRVGRANCGGSCGLLHAALTCEKAVSTRLSSAGEVGALRRQVTLTCIP